MLAALVFLIVPVGSGCGAGGYGPHLDGKPSSWDEIQLHDESARLDEAMRASDRLVTDPKLQPYLDAVLARVLTARGCDPQSFRILVVRDPFLNAVALPNGSIYVDTGLLARLENEAQLAGVLGHEIEHVTGKHALLEARSRERKETMFLGASLLLILAGGRGLPPGAASSIDTQVLHYRRDLETAADRAALTTMQKAGYDPHAFVSALESIRSDESEAGVVDPSPYADHPATDERIRLCTETLQSVPPQAAAKGGPAYDDAIASILLLNAAEDARLRRLEHARHGIDRMIAIRPQSAPAWLARAEVERRQSGVKDSGMEAAIADYRRALQLDPSLADAERALGLALRDAGRTREAQPHLRRYLELQPQAPDRGIVESYLRG